MSKAIENLVAAQKHAMNIRPQIGGFPYLAEILRQAGVTRNLWSLPSCQAIYLTDLGPVVQQGNPLVLGHNDIAKFNQDELILALRTDQAGKSSFPQFLESAWKAGVVGYEVDLAARKVTYHGALGESYVEEYPAVNIAG